MRAHLLECYDVVFVVEHVDVDKVDGVAEREREREEG